MFFPFLRIVLIFCIAGLLFIVLRARRTLGAYRIPRRPVFSSHLVTGATLTVAAARATPMTQEGSILGTFQYMSPEQVEGKEVDARSDIFSLGAVLYEMLSGQKAFEGKSQLSVASAILEK